MLRMILVSGAVLLLALVFSAPAALAGDKEDYMAKVKQNDETIGVIAGVIEYVCPKIAPKGSDICAGTDTVGKAVKLAKHIEDGGDVQNQRAADQFFDAVEQFKEHYPQRAKAKELAAKGDYAGAFGYEEFAWQYLVKTASRGVFAKKMVDGE